MSASLFFCSRRDKKYKERIGDIITAEVHQVWKKEILVLDDERNELILPKGEQIPNDYYNNVEYKGA